MFTDLPSRLYFKFIPGSMKKPIRNGLLAAFLIACYTLFIDNVYKAEAKILPADSRGGGVSQMAAAAAAVGVSVPGQESSDSAFVDIVTSRWMAKNLLAANYQFTTRSGYFGRPKVHNETLLDFLKVKNMDRAVKAMKDIISVKRDLKSKLLTITVETKSPELSHQIVRNAVNFLEEFIKLKSRTRGGNKAIFTAERLKEAQAECEKAEADSAKFLDAHRNYATSNDPSVRLRGASLETRLKLRQQVVTTLTLNYEQALIEEKNDMPILNILDGGDLPLDKSAPSRGMIVILAGLIVGGGTWLLSYLKSSGWLESLDQPTIPSDGPSPERGA